MTWPHTHWTVLPNSNRVWSNCRLHAGQITAILTPSVIAFMLFVCREHCTFTGKSTGKSVVRKEYVHLDVHEKGVPRR